MKRVRLWWGCEESRLCVLFGSYVDSLEEERGRLGRGVVVSVMFGVVRDVFARCMPTVVRAGLVLLF